MKWSLVTCASAASSLNASISTYSSGSSTLRDHWKNRLPSSARVASVNSFVSSTHWSAYSGFTFHLTQMKIMAGLLAGETSLGSDPMLPRAMPE